MGKKEKGVWCWGLGWEVGHPYGVEKSEEQERKLFAREKMKRGDGKKRFSMQTPNNMHMTEPFSHFPSPLPSPLSPSSSAPNSQILNLQSHRPSHFSLSTHSPFHLTIHTVITKQILFLYPHGPPEEEEEVEEGFESSRS